MKKISLLLALLVSTVNLGYSQTLDKHLWKDRVIIIKTNSTDNESFQKQIKAFTYQNDAFIERRLVLYTIENKNLTYTDYKKYFHKKISEQQSYFKNISNSKKDFQIILLGLDGEVKLKKNKPIKAEILYKTIDAMPMRKSELNSK